MDIEIAFMIYATLFKISVIAAGTFCIYLGFKLFPKTDSTSATPIPAGQQTIANAQVAGFEISFQSAAPGTAFAGFGVLLLCLMVFTGSPELTLPNDVKQGEARSPFLQLKGDGVLTNSGVIDTDEVKLLVVEGRKLISSGNYLAGGEIFSRLMAEYYRRLENDQLSDIETLSDQALTIYSYPSNNIADLQMKNGELNHALISSKLANRLSPQVPEIKHTLQEIHARR